MHILSSSLHSCTPLLQPPAPAQRPMQPNTCSPSTAAHACYRGFLHTSTTLHTSTAGHHTPFKDVHPVLYWHPLQDQGQLPPQPQHTMQPAGTQAARESVSTPLLLPCSDRQPTPTIRTCCVACACILRCPTRGGCRGANPDPLPCIANAHNPPTPILLTPPT